MSHRFYFEQNLWDLFQKRQGTLLILCQPRLGEVQKPPKFGWHLLHAVCTTSVFYSIFQGSPIQPETKTMHCLCTVYTYNDAAAMSIVSTKKTFKECISIPMAQVEGLLPLTPHPVPPSCWKVDKKGWDVFVIRIVSCLCHIRIVGCVSTGWWLPASAPPRLRAWARGSAQPKPNPSPSLNPQSAKPQKQKQRNRVGSSQVQQNDPVLRGLKENRPIIFSPSPPKLFYFFSELGLLPCSIF